MFFLLLLFFCLKNTTKCKSSSRHNSHILSSRVVDKPHTYTDPMKSTRCAKVSRRKIGFVVTPFVLVRERAERKQKSKVNCDWLKKRRRKQKCFPFKIHFQIDHCDFNSAFFFVVKVTYWLQLDWLLLMGNRTFCTTQSHQC